MTDPDEPKSPGLIRQMGPAWIVSAVACGPATMASVSLAGALFGYRFLWIVILSALFAFVGQYMAARLGLLTGRGIIAVVDQNLGSAWGWVLMIDALAATWLASTVLMKALVDVTGVITGLATPWWSLPYAALSSITDMRRRVLGGESFEELAREFSDCPSSEVGGDLGFFERGRMVEPFDEAAFSLGLGEISDIVETRFGYHIIKLIEKRPARTIPFEEIKADIEQYLGEQKIYAELGKIVDRLKSGAEKIRPSAPKPQSSCNHRLKAR